MKVETAGGEVIDLGTTETTSTIGIIDYSRRVTDDFGVTTVVERGFARRMSVRFALPFEDVDALQRQFADLRAAAATWTADDRFSWLSFEGFYKDFEVDLAVPPISYCTLTIEGLAETETVADSGGDPAPSGQGSTLRLLQPVIVEDGAFVSSTVPESDYPQWVAGTTYAAGVRVIKLATHRIYESLVNDNAGNDPASAADKWLDVGPTNRWAMFDQALGTATTAAAPIVVTLDVDDADAVALLDVTATTVRVQATGYDRTLAVSNGAVSFLDLPGASGQVTVTISGGSALAVGTLLAGRLVDLGITEASPTAGITDYSRKETDDFGEVTIVQRAWAKRMAAKALIATDAIDLVANRIATVRARPSLWIGQSGLDSLTIYGFFKDFSIEVGETVSKLSLSIEGLSKAAPLREPTTEELARLWASIADLETAAGAAATLAAGKSTIFYRSTPPTSAESQEGDLWINTADGNRSYRHVAGSGRLVIGGNRITIGGNYVTLPWVLADDQRIGAALTAAAGAQATADGKVTTFSQMAEPTAVGIGDLWFNPSTGSLKRWSGSLWLEVSTVGATPAEAADIAASKAAVAAIVSDDVLSRGEKPQFAREWQEAQARYAAIDAKAATFGNVATERTALTAAYNALAAAITAIAPAYNNVGVDSPIDGAALSAKWADFYTAYAALDMALTAQTLAVEWSADGEGDWHEDYTGGDKWQRQSTNGGASWGDPVKVVGEDGADGADGEQGPQGIPGTPGADGQTLYTWIAYANAADGSLDFTTGNPGTRSYIGLAPNKTTPVEGTDPAAYAWSKIIGPQGEQGIQGEQGEQGVQGVQGVQGPPGEDGTPRYIWIAYANSADGTVDFTNGAPGTRTYIGVAPNKLTAAESSTPADYSWAKIEGPQGAAGADGADGTDGIDGQHTSFVFIRSANQPDTPTSATTPPAGWSDAPPVQTDPPLPLWQSRADFRNADRLTAWSTPIKLIAASLADLDPDAAALLTQAKDIADGKNRIFRQSTAPTAAESQPNDLWINTAAGNRTLVRVAGSGRLAIGGNAITIGGDYVTLPWIESPDADLGTALEQAAQAISDARAAQATADGAIEQIEALADDGQLTGAEKLSVLIPKDAALDGAWSALDTQAAALGVTTERTAASDARAAWQAYRDGLSPAWNDTTQSTSVVRATFRSKLSTYEDALAALQSAISAAAAQRAEWEKVTGAKPPDNADNTAENQHVLVQPAPIVVKADYTGAIDAGQLPVQRLAARLLGDTDVSRETTYSVSATGGLTVAINDTANDDERGTVTLSAMTVASGTITIFSTYLGLQLYTTVPVTRDDAAPPASGGGGGSGDAGAPASTSSFTPNSTTTHAPICDPLKVTVGASGEVDLTAPLTYHATSQGSLSSPTLPTSTFMAIKWQFSTDSGSSWTDVASEAEGSAAQAYFRVTTPKGPVDNPGYVSSAPSKTGLSAGSVWFRLVGRMTSGIGIASITGTATATPQ